jgi:hypothetical protein
MKLELSGFTTDHLRRLLLIGLNKEREAISIKIAELEAREDTSPKPTAKPTKVATKVPAKSARGNGASNGTRGPMSPAARQRIVDAQKKRWARVRKAKLLAERDKAAKRVARHNRALNSEEVQLPEAFSAE